MLAMTLFMIAASAAADFSAGQSEATPPPSDERLICRSRPTLGSRITRTRVCKTAADWRIYEADMEQHRRDTADRGARGCSPGTLQC